MPRFGFEFHRQKPSLPEVTYPINYAVAYDWGRLVVTDDAHEAYGLFPFASDIVRGGVPKEKGRFIGDLPQVAITLVGPNEVSADFRGSNAASCDHRLHKRSLEVIVGFPETTQAYGERIASILNRGAEGDIGGIPTAEFAATRRAHELTYLSQLGVRANTPKWLRQRGQEKIMKETTRIGGLSFCTALVLTTATETVTGQVNVYEPGFALGLLATGFYLSQNTLREYFKDESRQETDFKETSAVYADRVGQSVHRTFCSEFINHDFEERFKADE